MTVAAAIAWGRSRLGDVENPPGSNRVDIWDEYHRLTGAPAYQGSFWCGALVVCMARHGGFAAPADFIQVRAAHAWAADQHRYVAGLGGVQPGDFAVFDRDEHIEFVVSVPAPGEVTNIGGNTSNHGYNPNGGGVYENTRTANVVMGYLRVHDLFGTAPRPAPTPSPIPRGPAARPAPAHAAPPFPLPAGSYFGPRTGPNQSVSGYFGHRDQLATWQRQMIARGWHLAADGYYGPGTEQVTRQFQTEKHLTVDGQIGPKTWAAAWTAAIT